MSTDRPYQPIECSLHDRLESAATQRTRVSIAYRGPQGEPILLEDRIADVFSRNGAEFMKLEGGAEIRLDDVDSVDGAPF